ncbi:MAG: enhanced intracellular survival protein Eis [Mycobacterium leprae]
MAEIIRHLRPEELPAAVALHEYAFSLSPEAATSLVGHLVRPENALGAFDGDELLAMAIAVPYQSLWDGTPVALGGIGSVCAAPAARQGGTTSRVLRACLIEMREKGQALSALYPFSFRYYRQFGYELAGDNTEYKLASRSLASFQKAPGKVQHLTPEAALPLIAPLYDAYAAEQQGAFVRDEAVWRGSALIPWSMNTYHVAVWSPTTGAAPEGYMLYRIASEADGRALVVRELVARTPGALRGLTGYIANHESQVANVRLTLPPDSPFAAILPEQHQLRRQVSPHFMLRLIDLPAALAARRPAGPEGRITLQVTDASAPWNEGAWLLEAAGGRLTATPAPAGATADIETDIAALAPLYAGYTGVEGLELAGRLKVADRRAATLLGQWLPRRQAWFNEAF